jgi:lysozyme
VWGCDVSFYQDEDETPQGIDFRKMKDAGASFVIIRAGQNLWKDPDFDTNWKAAKEAGLPRGAYWYLDVKAGMRGQAKIFADCLRGDMGELPPSLDFEQEEQRVYEAQNKRWVKKTLNIGDLNAFKTYLREYLPELDVDKTIIYTGYYYWKDNGSPDKKYLSHPLWIGNYNSEPMIPLPWTSYHLWQFAETGPGKELGVESNAIDMNYWGGDLASFLKFCGGPVIPPPTPEPIPEKVYPSTVTLNYSNENVLYKLDKRA